ncbi:MAG: replication initiation factor domain-containing protein [Gammaproteobacteria bacterium]|nr:replication initiation factor domain-containing protein [Gammaproteobacteria bacterium]
MDIHTRIDWMSITFPHEEALMRLLPFEHRIKPIKSPIPIYPICFETFPHRAKILVSNQDRLGKHIILSGKTLQSMYDDDISAKSIYTHITANKGKFSRIDIALDIFDVPDFTVQKFLGMLDHADTALKGHKYIGSENGVETVYLGNMKSRSRRFRCYDKAVEQGITDFAWVRLEYEKRRKANLLAKRVFIDEISIASLIKGIIDFPNWKLYQDVMNCEKSTTFRGKEIYEKKSWEDTLEWLITTACTSLANCTYEEFLEQLNTSGNIWSIEDSVVLNRFSEALAAKLREKFDS